MEYVRVGVMQLKGSMDEVNRLAREGALPMYRKIAGFLSYDLVPSSDGKNVISITRWRTREAAEQGGRNAADFVRDKASHVVSLVTSYIGPATVSAGAREDARPSAPSYPG
ncbi:MAG: antibiotic biosynthesis monooxygenase [Deltaproteobacteria bacterium]|nr:antibiotic biosynthesis monooxygenase [Deltaproteobacteria bacterium]